MGQNIFDFIHFFPAELLFSKFPSLSASSRQLVSRQLVNFSTTINFNTIKNRCEHKNTQIFCFLCKKSMQKW